MIYGSTKTKLDYIIELGCKRIDAAVEGVIAKYDDNHWCSGPQWTDQELPIVTTPKYEFNRTTSHLLTDVAAQQAAFGNPKDVAAQQAAFGNPNNLFEHSQQQHRGNQGIGCAQGRFE